MKVCTERGKRVSSWLLIPALVNNKKVWFSFLYIFPVIASLLYHTNLRHYRMFQFHSVFSQHLLNMSPNYAEFPFLLLEVLLKVSLSRIVFLEPDFHSWERSHSSFSPPYCAVEKSNPLALMRQNLVHFCFSHWIHERALNLRWSLIALHST